jgi:hypothetical protein
VRSNFGFVSEFVVDELISLPEQEPGYYGIALGQS